MKWDELQQRLEMLESRFAGSEDVRREAAALQGELSGLAEGPELAPARAQLLARKAEVIRTHLTVGSLDLPSDASEALRALAGSFQDRIITEALGADFKQSISDFLAEARGAAQRRAALERELGDLRATVALLESWKDLLDTLAAQGGS